MQLSTLFSAFLLLGRAMGAAVPEPAGKAIKVAKDQTPAPTRNCLHTKCKCWGNPGTWKTAKLYCGYCEDVVPVTGGPNLHGNEMFACGPGPDQCCDMGYSDTCQNVIDYNEWCGKHDAPALVDRAIKATVPKAEEKAVKVAKSLTPAPATENWNCKHTQCKCIAGSMPQPKLFCGYCEAIIPVTGGPNLSGNEMFICGPGGDNCCDLGYSDTCASTNDNFEWCGKQDPSLIGAGGDAVSTKGYASPTPIS